MVTFNIGVGLNEVSPNYVLQFKQIDTLLCMISIYFLQSELLNLHNNVNGRAGIDFWGISFLKETVKFI